MAAASPARDDSQAPRPRAQRRTRRLPSLKPHARRAEALPHRPSLPSRLLLLADRNTPRLGTTVRSSCRSRDGHCPCFDCPPGTSRLGRRGPESLSSSPAVLGRSCSYRPDRLGVAGIAGPRGAGLGPPPACMPGSGLSRPPSPAASGSRLSSRASSGSRWRAHSEAHLSNVREGGAVQVAAVTACPNP